MPGPAPLEDVAESRPGVEDAAPAGSVTIGRLRAADLPGLLALERRCFTGVYAAHRFARVQFLAYGRSARAYCLVATLEDRQVGYVAASLAPGRASRTMRLDSLAVVPSMRGVGVGSRLLERVVEEARGLGCTGVTLEVAEANRLGRDFFLARGFRLVRRVPAYYAPRQDGLRMRRLLRDAEGRGPRRPGGPGGRRPAVSGKGAAPRRDAERGGSA